MSPHRFYCHHASRFAANPSLFIPAPHDLVVRSELSLLKGTAKQKPGLIRHAEVEEALGRGDKVRKPDLRRFNNLKFYIANPLGLFARPESGGHSCGRALAIDLFAMHLLQMIEARSRGISMVGSISKSYRSAQLNMGDTASWEQTFVPQRLIEGHHKKGYRTALHVPLNLLSAFERAVAAFWARFAETGSQPVEESRLVRSSFKNCFFWKAERDLMFSYILLHSWGDHLQDAHLGKPLALRRFYDSLREESDRAADKICSAIMFRRTKVEEVVLARKKPKGRYDDDVGGGEAIYRRNAHIIPYVTDPVKVNPTDHLVLLSILPSCRCTQPYFNEIEDNENRKRDQRYLLEISGGLDSTAPPGCERCAGS